MPTPIRFVFTRTETFSVWFPDSSTITPDEAREILADDPESFRVKDTGFELASVTRGETSPIFTDPDN